MYILDEPTIGLHPRDNRILLDTLEKLQAKADQIETSTRSVLPGQTGKKPIPVQVQESHGIAKLIAAGTPELAAGARDAPFIGLGVESGKAYLNIHTAAFPGGEIRGFLTPAPEPSSGKRFRHWKQPFWKRRTWPRRAAA